MLPLRPSSELILHMWDLREDGHRQHNTCLNNSSWYNYINSSIIILIISLKKKSCIPRFKKWTLSPKIKELCVSFTILLPHYYEFHTLFWVCILVLAADALTDQIFLISPITCLTWASAKTQTILSYYITIISYMLTADSFRSGSVFK